MRGYWARHRFAALPKSVSITLVERYDLACPNGHTTFLRERTLRRIVDNLHELDRGDPQITFVCSQCKIAFRFDYLNRKSEEGIDELPQSSEPFVFIVKTRCGNKRCGSRAELVAVRSSDTSPARFGEEALGWQPICQRCGSVASAAVLRSIRQGGYPLDSPSPNT